MKAVLCRRYGAPETLVVDDLPRPDPGPGEVLVRVRSSSVVYADLALVRGRPAVARLWTGLRTPRDPTPGVDVAGVVEATGEGADLFVAGDEVFGDLSESGFGAWAEYAAAPEDVFVRKPSNISFEEAAAAPQAAVVALQALRDRARLQPGQRVLIVGASGGNGTFAVQIARAMGAHVTGVCGTRNVDLVRELGADRVLDYTRDDFADGRERWDVILGLAGYRSILDYRRALNAGGTYVVVGGAGAQVFQGMTVGPVLSLVGSQSLTFLFMGADRGDLEHVGELIEAGRIRSVIDRTFPLDAAADALAHYALGRTTGKVVITT